MSVWLIVLGVGFGTYTFRASMFVLLGSHRLPTWAHVPLGFVGPAAIGALVGGMVLTDGERFAPSGVPELVAVAAGFVVVRRSGDVARGLLVGFPVLWALTALGL